MEKSNSMFRESGPTEQKVFRANNRSNVLVNSQHIEDVFQKKITESLSEGGSSTLTETARNVLKAISDNIVSLSNDISVE